MSSFMSLDFSHMTYESTFVSPSGVVRTVTPFSHPLLLDIAKEILVKKGRKDDETIHSFFSRRLGKEVIPNCSFCQQYTYL